MKVISIHQPWAWAIVSGHKKIENRSWKTSYRGDLLIHSTANVNQLGVKWIENVTNLKVPKYLPTKSIIGKVTLEDISFNGAFLGWDDKLKQQERLWGFYDFEHWLFLNNYQFKNPIEIQGQQSLWVPPKNMFKNIYKEIDECLNKL